VLVWFLLQTDKTENGSSWIVTKRIWTFFNKKKCWLKWDSSFYWYKYTGTCTHLRRVPYCNLLSGVVLRPSHSNAISRIVSLASLQRRWPQHTHTTFSFFLHYRMFPPVHYSKHSLHVHNGFYSSRTCSSSSVIHSELFTLFCSTSYSFRPRLSLH
jgi:hypothetical protein